MGAQKPVTVKSWKALLAACEVWDRRGDDDNDPKGCPQPRDFDSEDDRHGLLESASPGVVTYRFPSHNEYYTSWQLHWTDRWRLQAIDAGLW